MTIREIITKLETENSNLLEENKLLKKEIERLTSCNFGIERELKSLKKLINEDEAVITVEEDVIKIDDIVTVLTDTKTTTKRRNKKKISE